MLADEEGVHVAVLPAHDDLNDFMQLVEHDVGRNNKSTPDGVRHIEERNFQEIGTRHGGTKQMKEEWKTPILPVRSYR